MFERIFRRIHDGVTRRRTAVLWIVAVAGILASVGVFFVRYESSIDLMFPEDRDIRRSIDFLREAKLSDKVVVSLALTDPAKNTGDLIRAVDRLAAHLTPPLFTKVTTGISGEKGGFDLSILKLAPQILSEQDLRRIDGRLTRQGVDDQLRGIYRSSMKMESIFTNAFVRSDPMNVRQLIFEKLRAVPTSMGYEVSIENGHFVSRDGRHAMLIMETPVKMTDGRASAQLVDTLREGIAELPSFVSGDIISGHVHAVSNERVIKRDISLASALVTVAFLLLFVALFPDPRIAFVFLIPLIGIAWAINAASLVLGNLSYLVVGIGTAVAGITVDYGLHMYIALRNASTADQVTSVSRLLMIDSVTTMFGFGALFLSRVQGYHELAFFAILCVVFSLLLAVFVLPLLLTWNAPPDMRGASWGERAFEALLPKRSYVVVWAVLTIVMLLFAKNIRFESDVMRLDGSEPSVREAEQRFYQTWGGESNQAIFVVSGRTLEDALQANDAVYADAVSAIGEKNFTSLSPLWPAERKRAENIEQWNRFWKQGRAERLKRLLKQELPRFGMREQAFAPFFDGLYADTSEAGTTGLLLQKLRERFVVRNGDEYRVMSFFPDERQFVDALQPISGKQPGAFLVSRKAVSGRVSAFTFGELKFLVPVALLFNVVLTWLFFRNLMETIIALVPLVTGLIWLAGFMAILKIPLDVVNIISMVVVTGVIVDYGTGVTYEYQFNLKIGTILAVSLSAITTIVGCGVMLFARHPVMFSIGVGMTVSVTAGYLTSILIVPSLCDLLVKTHRREVDA